MSLAITLKDWLGPYADHPDGTPAVREAAIEMLTKVNELYAMAADDGLAMPDNPSTGTGVAGQRNGGFRPQVTSVGAKGSRHKDGHAVDRYDPKREFARWCLRNLDELSKRGLHMEDPRWTPTWVHLQDVPPGSGRRIFIPSADKPLAPALPEQGGR